MHVFVSSLFLFLIFRSEFFWSMGRDPRGWGVEGGYTEGMASLSLLRMRGLKIEDEVSSRGRGKSGGLLNKKNMHSRETFAMKELSRKFREFSRVRKKGHLTSVASCQRRYSARATNGSAGATDGRYRSSLASPMGATDPPWQVQLASDVKLCML